MLRTTERIGAGPLAGPAPSRKPVRQESRGAPIQNLNRVLARLVLDGDPAQLGELLGRPFAAEAAPAAGLDAAERHLRLVMHGGVVDVADAALDPSRQLL